MPKLTKEVLKKLRGYAMAEGRVEFVPKILVDVDDNGESVFLEEKYCPKFDIQLPTNSEYRGIRKELAKDDEEYDNVDLVDKIVCMFVKGWKNYHDVNTGDEVEFDAKRIADLLPNKLKQEIFVFISDTTGLA